MYYIKKANVLFKLRLKLNITILITREIIKRIEIKFMTAKLVKGEILNDKKKFSYSKGREKRERNKKKCRKKQNK